MFICKKEQTSLILFLCVSFFLTLTSHCISPAFSLSLCSTNISCAFKAAVPQLSTKYPHCVPPHITQLTQRSVVKPSRYTIHLTSPFWLSFLSCGYYSGFSPASLPNFTFFACSYPSCLLVIPPGAPQDVSEVSQKWLAALLR